MKKILILFFAVLFMTIGGCQKNFFGNKFNKTNYTMTNDIITELIKEDAISNTNGVAVPETNAALTENIAGGPFAMADKKNPEKVLPDEPVVGVDKTAKTDKIIKDVPIEVPQNNGKPSVKESRKGTYLKVGDDDNAQTVSKQKVVKITTVVFSPVKNGRYVDFSIYAVPAGKSKAHAVLLTHVVNIDIINGQAQFTRYWNGKNIDGEFIKKGKYNLFVSYTIKDPDKDELTKENRSWGANKNFYIRLY